MSNRCPVRLMSLDGCPSPNIFDNSLNRDVIVEFTGIYSEKHRGELRGPFVVWLWIMCVNARSL